MRKRARSTRQARAALLQLISLLLQYPDDELTATRPELAAAARALPESPSRESLVAFTTWYAAEEPMQLARHYVDTFDLRRRSSLYLTYYLHGDTRRRGMAMAALKQRYRDAGLNPPESELPDYVPVVCEFAALTGPEVGEAALIGHRHGLELIRAALHKHGSPYALVLDALCAHLPTLAAADQSRLADLALAGPPTELVGLTPFTPAGHAATKVRP